HDGIDSGEDRPLERFLIQRGRVVAVFCSIVQAADTAPYHALFATFGPSTSAVQRSAFTADQPLRESIFAGVGCHAGGRILFGGALSGTAPRYLCLYGIEGFAIYNPIMVILYQIHGKLPGIADDLSADAVTDIGFLQQDISAIFLVSQDRPDE